MNYIKQPEFSTFKQYLREDEDNMFAGVRGVIQDVRNAWTGGSRQKVERQRINAVKKLSPAQLSAMSRNVNMFISEALTNLSNKPNYSIVTNGIANAEEANAAVNVFMDLANSRLDPASAAQSKIADLARSFLHAALLDKAITQETNDRLFQHVLNPGDIPLGAKNALIFSNNHDFFKRVFALDNMMGLHPADGGELLHKKLAGDPDDGKQNKTAAVVGVANGLQRFRFICLTMIDMLKAEGAKRGPPKAVTPPTGGTGAPAHPAAKKPPSNTPGGASMQPQADANQAAAKNGGTATAPQQPVDQGAAISPQQENDDAIAALTKLGYNSAVARRLVSRVPKGTKADAAVQMVLKGQAGR